MKEEMTAPPEAGASPEHAPKSGPKVEPHYHKKAAILGLSRKHDFFSSELKAQY